MNRLERDFWNHVQGWPLALVQLGLQAAIVAEYLTVLLKTLNGPRTLQLMPVYPVRQWLRLYRDHARTYREIGIALGVEDADHVIRWVVAFDRLSLDERRAVLDEFPQGELVEIAREGAQEILAELRSELHELMKLPTSNQLGFDDSVLNTMEAQFVVRVTLPCWLLYREHPATILRRARSGDLDAITDLVRLDKSVVGDPRVLRATVQASRDENAVRIKRIADALGSRSLKGSTAAKLKARLASMLSAFAAAMGRPLNEPQIRGLFDFVARAKGKGRDYDLPAGSEALAKSIQRDRSKWPLPGQKSRI